MDAEQGKEALKHLRNMLYMYATEPNRESCSVEERENDPFWRALVFMEGLGLAERSKGGQHWELLPLEDEQGGKLTP